jgi:hypothetical protein
MLPLESGSDPRRTPRFCVPSAYPERRRESASHAFARSCGCFGATASRRGSRQPCNGLLSLREAAMTNPFRSVFHRCGPSRIGAALGERRSSDGQDDECNRQGRCEHHEPSYAEVRRALLPACGASELDHDHRDRCRRRYVCTFAQAPAVIEEAAHPDGRDITGAARRFRRTALLPLSSFDAVWRDVAERSMTLVRLSRLFRREQPFARGRS